MWPYVPQKYGAKRAKKAYPEIPVPRTLGTQEPKNIGMNG